MEALSNNLSKESRFGMPDQNAPDTCEEILRSVCDRSLQRKRNFGERKRAVYWWSEEIANLRKECLRKKRELVRGNGKNITVEERKVLQMRYVAQKSTLRKAITAAKDKAWKDLCAEVDNDGWGDGYKIVLKKFKTFPKIQLSKEEKLQMAKKLFPIGEWQIRPLKEKDITTFTSKELEEAASRLKLGKAPGPDAFPPEVIKALIENQPQYCLQLMNRLLNAGEFPATWKEARLVLLEKPRKEGQTETTYRPLCLLNVMGKVLEHLLVQRLLAELERNGGPSDSQHGFRKGHSTIDALKDVQGLVRGAQEGTWRTKELCVLIALDVENAFNSASWQLIIDELDRRNISPYIIRMIESYFSARTLAIDGSRIEVTQGSVMGPLLWNILYDGVLRMQLPEGAKLIGYADDPALVLTSKDEPCMRQVARDALTLISEWLKTHHLKLSLQKTEAIILAGRRTLTEFEVNVEGVTVRCKEYIKYLGITIGKNWSMKAHVQAVARKAEATTKALGRLMPNSGGPRASRRRVICSVVFSILLYGAPIWEHAMKVERFRNYLKRIVRQNAARVSSAYRTASTEALEVIAGFPPIDLLVAERTRLYEEGRESRPAAREWLLQKWQERWQQTEKGAWTRKLIPRVKPWLERKHGELDFHLIQALTGHGCFAAFLHRIGKQQDDGCWYCGVSDDAEHTLFVCEKWDHERLSLMRKTTSWPTTENFTDILLQSGENWNAAVVFVRRVLTEKEKHERERETRNRLPT
ncbi:hypothetical protein MTP99_009165 [Tenebrio molitor]|nr:hypothetical protein MTP99_009165 [Tenebrio molitor]